MLQPTGHRLRLKCSASVMMHRRARYSGQTVGLKLTPSFPLPASLFPASCWKNTAQVQKETSHNLDAHHPPLHSSLLQSLPFLFLHSAFIFPSASAGTSCVRSLVPSTSRNLDAMRSYFTQNKDEILSLDMHSEETHWKHARGNFNLTLVQ